MDAAAGALTARRAVEQVDAEQAARTADGGEGVPAAGAGMARNTAIFSIATGLSRIAGLAREIVAASYFGTSGPASAFTIAFQVPNLVRGLFADAALSAAFVPIFAEYLEQRRRREAILLASTLFWIILLVLGALTALFIVGAGVIMPIFIPGDQFSQQLVDLTVGLSQVLFPVVVLLGINGLLVGIANSYHHFTIPALAPLVWNIVIIGALIALRPLFHGQNQIYAYAIGVLIGTIVQLLMVVPGAREDRLPAEIPPRLAQSGRHPCLPADAAGDDRARRHQRRPADQLGGRRPDLTGRPARDRRGVSHLHAAAGHLQRRARDGPVPLTQPARRAPRHERAASPASGPARARTCCC